MIVSLEAHDYRILGNVAVTFEPLTIVVGPNACGKSTLLEALSMMAGVSGQNLRNQPLPDIQLLIEISQPGGSGPYVGVALSKTRHGGVQRGNLERSERPKRTLSLKLVPSVLRQESSISSTPGTISSEGAGLAAMLADMKLNDDPRLERVIASLSSVVPNIRTVRPKREPDRATYSLTFETITGDILPAHAMSDGTLYTLGVLTALSSAEGAPALVVVDDIDQGLHPRAQSELVKQLRAIQQLQPGLQIVATSHSPYLLDCVDPKEVRILALGPDGRTRAAKLTEHPEYERWKDVMAPGEFWSSVGEGWLEKLNP